MRPTIAVNLGGLQFIFNDDAYRLMSEYLLSLTDIFRAQSLDAEELVSDIENRCAEILSENHNRHSYIFTERDITALIDRMGHPEELIEEQIVESPGYERVAVSQQAGPPPFRPTPQPPLKKRLFRIQHGKELGGVCGGLAAYCGWDPTYVRLATVALAFISLSTVAIVYIVLWIVVPMAKTPLQEMELRGESPTLKNIGNVVKKTFNFTEEEITGSKRAPYEKLTDIEDDNRNRSKLMATGTARFFSIIAKIIIAIVGFVSSLVTLLMIVTILYSIIWGCVHLVSDINLPEYFMAKMGILICGAVAVGMPMCLVTMLCWRAIFHRPAAFQISAAWKLALFIIWTISIFMTASLSWFVQYFNPGDSFFAF